MNIFGNCLCVFLLWASLSQGAVEGSQDELLARLDALEQREKVHTAQIHRLEQQNQEYSQQLKNLQETNVLLKQDLENTYSQLQDNNKVIESVTVELREKNEVIESMQKEMKYMQQKANTQEEIVKQLQADMNRLQYGNEKTKERVDSTSNSKAKKIDSLMSEGGDDKGQIEHLFTNFAITNRNERSSYKRQTDQLYGSVAFHAVLTPYETNLSSPQTIVFDHALLNLGNSYHVQHGLFIAPKSGLYLFSASITSDGVHFWAGILKNGETLVGIIAPDDSGLTQGSATVITQLNQGDEVWVRHEHPPSGKIWGNSFTSFCGILLVEN